VRHRLGRICARPIGDERRPAFLAAALVLVIAAATLSLAGRPHHAMPRTGRPTRPEVTVRATPALAAAIPTVGGSQVSGTGPAGAMAAGQAFLTAYLRFAYGHAPPRFPDATPALGAQLAGFHVAVTPVQRLRHVSLLALRARAHGDGWEVTALASDGVASFPVAVIVAREHGRWLAVRLVTVAGG